MVIATMPACHDFLQLTIVMLPFAFMWHCFTIHSLYQHVVADYLA